MERKKTAINYLLITLVVILGIIQVYMLNKHSTMGDQLNLINKKVAEKEEDNNRLSQKIASLSAMTAITKQAELYGLVSSSQVLSVANSLPLASNLKFSL